jgi:prevent-host-death family protein
MIDIINIHEAKTHLSRLVDRAAAGDDIVIARAGKPVARLTRIEAPAGAGPRQPGMFAGLVVPDAFFDPLPDEELSAWE